MIDLFPGLGVTDKASSKINWQEAVWLFSLRFMGNIMGLFVMFYGPKAWARG